jgi:hypothetical protein
MDRRIARQKMYVRPLAQRPLPFDSARPLWQGGAISRKAGRCPGLAALARTAKGFPMPKDEWGKKRICPTTGKRFYDLNRVPVVSPYTGLVVNIDTVKTRTMVADAEDMQTKKLKVGEEEDDLLLDDDVAADDADLGDEVLEEEEDDDVSFDELGDVAADDE